MLRSIRIPILASFVALIFVACGGGETKPHGQQDGGQQDGNHIQFDAQHDGIPPQQDGPLQNDGGTGACVTTGGVATAGICKASKPCTCPNDCFDPGDSTMAGSCWPIPDPSTGCANSTDVPVYFTGAATNTAHCFPTGTIATGTFSVPIGTNSTAGGSASVSVTVNGISYAPTHGWAEHDTTNSVWVVYLMPASTTAPLNVIILQIADADYNTTPIDFATNTTSAIFGLQVTSNSEIGSFDSYDQGTLTFTSAPTGSSGTVTGSLSNVEVFAAPVELCGPNTSACQ